MKLEKSTDFEEIISNGLVLVDFFATWCGPCKMLAPVLEELASEYEEKLTILKVDVDEFSSIASKYSIYSIPTLLLFKDGELVKKSVGFKDLDALKTFIEL